MGFQERDGAQRTHFGGGLLSTPAALPHPPFHFMPTPLPPPPSLPPPPPSLGTPVSSHYQRRRCAEGAEIVKPQVFQGAHDRGWLCGTWMRRRRREEVEGTEEEEERRGEERGKRGGGGKRSCVV